MRTLFILLLCAVITYAAVTRPRVPAFNCSCAYCDFQKVIALEEGNATTPSWAKYEDVDADGDLTICARDRDLEDRTFPSICYMMCFNKCTRFRVVVEEKNDTKIRTVISYRTNYYKLKDGRC